jgi:hypothetical protein
MHIFTPSLLDQRERKRRKERAKGRGMEGGRLLA